MNDIGFSCLALSIAMVMFLAIWWYLGRVVWLSTPMSLVFSMVVTGCAVEYMRTRHWFLLMPIVILLCGLVARYFEMWEQYRWDYRFQKGWSYDALFSSFCLMWPVYCVYSLIYFGIRPNRDYTFISCAKALFLPCLRKRYHPFENGYQEGVCDYFIQSLSKLLSCEISSEEFLADANVKFKDCDTASSKIASRDEAENA